MPAGFEHELVCKSNWKVDTWKAQPSGSPTTRRLKSDTPTGQHVHTSNGLFQVHVKGQALAWPALGRQNGDNSAFRPVFHHALNHTNAIHQNLGEPKISKAAGHTQRHTADWAKCVVEKVYQSKIIDRLCPCLWGSWFISSLIINKLMIHVHMSSGKLNCFDKGRNMGNWNTTIRQGGLTGLALAACHYQRRIWPVHLMRPEENSVFANLICRYVQSASKLHTTANFECLCWVVTPSHYPAIYIGHPVFCNRLHRHTHIHTHWHTDTLSLCLISPPFLSI